MYDFMDLTEKINTHAFSKYLKDTGWKPFPTKRTYIRIFQTKKDSGEAFQVNIPMDKNLLDYKDAMFQAIETVAFVEGQPIEQLMLYLLNPNTDILKIRIDRKDIEAGSIFFDDAIRVYENAKKLLLATVQDILHPKRYHRGRVDESIGKFISNCKFGQTEIGSYIVSVVCPFAELDDSEGYRQLSIFSDEDQFADSLTRKVTCRIMDNVALIKSHIDNGEYDALVSENDALLISTNFYEALGGLNLDNEETGVEFIAQWSPVVKNKRSTCNRVMLTHDYYQPIADTVGKLRTSIRAKTRIVGRIKKLESAPDASSRTSGKITVVYLDENENKKTVTATLTKEDHDKAIKAYESGKYVEILGDITNAGSRSSIRYEAFSVIE